MPTIRSQFSFQQFERVLQKMAHHIALDAVKTLKRGGVRIVIHGDHFDTVETSKCGFRFYAEHASYSENGGWSAKWGFDVEEKLYLSSNHCSKISFWAPDDEVEETEKRIREFIDKIMADVEPIQRFSLSKYKRRKG